MLGVSPVPNAACGRKILRQCRRKGGRYARKNTHDLHPADGRGAQEAVADLRRLRLACQRGGPGNDWRRYHPPAAAAGIPRSICGDQPHLNVRKKRRQHLYTALADAEALAPSKALYEEGLTGMEAEFEKYMEAVKQLKDCGISAERLTEEKAEIYEQLASLNREIRAERRKLKLCQEIRQQMPAMEQDIQNTDEHQKEVQEHEKHCCYMI